MSPYTYVFRRFGRWLQSPELVCVYKWCARHRVGFSLWCREHTDRILADEDITDWPRKH